MIRIIHIVKHLKLLLFVAWASGSLTQAQAQGGFSKLYTEGSGATNILFDNLNIITAAQTSNTNFVRGILFLKLNAQGDTLLSRTFFDNSRDMYPGLQNGLIKSGDNYFLVGRRAPEAFIMKLDTSFNVLDTSFFQISDEWTWAISLTEAVNHDFLVAGTIYWTDSVTQNSRKGFLCARFDNQLNLKWIKRYHTPSVNGKTIEQQAYNIMEDSGGNIWMGGYRQAISGDNVTDVLIMRLDSTGNKLFEQTYGDPNLDEGIATILESPDSNYIVVSNLGIEVGHFAGETGAKTKIRVSKIDSAGTILWDKVYGPKRLTNFVTDAEIMSTGEIVVSGYYIDSDVDYTLREALFRSYSFKTNLNGDSIWYREYIGGTHYNDWNRLFDIAPAPDGGLVAAGHFLSEASPLTGQAGSHVWIIRTDSLGCVVAGCQNISRLEERSIDQIKLFPNPSQSFFRLEGLQGCTVDVHIYNSSGKEISYFKDVNEEQSIKLTGYSAGLYWVKIVGKGKVLHTQKLMVIPS